MQSSEDEAQMAADRKRRLTAPTSPHRRHGPAQEEGSSRGAGVGSSVNAGLPGSAIRNAIDLTSDDDERPLPPTPPAPPPPAHPIPRTSRPTVPTVTSSRRQSEFVLPRWQPDADVSQCPVCHNQFTFLYRRHHCRKCGRVVCANCSPHRITIPRQFIVRPPEPPGGILDLTGENSSSPTNATPQQLWGGEEVRVCNPCVPDPNLSPPPQYTPQQGPQRYPDMIPPQNWRATTDAALLPSLRHPPQQRVRNSSGPLPPLPGQQVPPQYMGHRATLSDASGMPTYQRMMGHNGGFPGQPPTLRDLYAPPLPPHAMNYPPRVSSAMGGAFGTSAPSHLPAPSRPYHNRPLIDIPTAPRPAAPEPVRRQIAEEDECPICRAELPPKGPNGETAERERHVDECIASHFGTSTPPSRTTSAPPDTTSTAEGSASAQVPPTAVPGASASNAGQASTTPTGVTPSSSAPSRQRRMTGGRMLPYKATEKDCVGEDGQASECVICLEDFEPGDEMGRLECFCRFHKVSLFSPFSEVL